MDTEDEIKTIYASGRKDLLVFSVLTNPKYTINWHHQVIARELEDIEDKVINGSDKQVFLLLEVPPRHGKSEEASINFPAWFLGRNPDKEIITASYSGDLATDFGSKTRDLVASPEYKAIFDTQLMEDSKSKSKWLTTKRGSYTSVGVGGALTGRGANILLIDDPIKSREEADSEVIRNKIWEWFRSTAYSRLEPNGAVIVIMQRWHLDDLVGRIVKEYGHRDDIELKRVKFPALAQENEEYRKVGQALWPERYDRNALYSIRKTIGEMNWASQYQQVPRLQEHMEFKEEHFNYFEDEDIEHLDLDYTTTVDLATGDKEVKNGDYVAIITVGKEKSKPNWYIVDCKIERLDPLQTCDYLFMLYERYRMRKVVVEQNSYQRTFKFWLTEEMKKREVYLPISGVTNTMKKGQRIRGLVPMYKTGVIYHRRNYLLLESQLLNFPVGDHDDGPDALAMQQDAIKPTIRDSSSYEEAAEQYIYSTY